MKEWRTSLLYWEDVHIHQDKTILAGCSLEVYDRFLRMGSDLQNAKTVLEIGVGTCAAIKDLIVMEKVVDAVDVGVTALKNAYMAGVRHAETFHSFLESSGLSYDLVICHLVVQHLSNAETIQLVWAAIDSLSENGVFYLQFASPMEGIKLPESLEERCIAGLMLRSEEEIYAIALSKDAKIEFVNERRFPKDKVVWHAAKIWR